MSDALVDALSDRLRRAIVRGMQKYHLPGAAAGCSAR
jgi:hypothetical protein